MQSNKWKLKTTTRYHCSFNRLATQTNNYTSSKSDNIHWLRAHGKVSTLLHYWWDINWYSLSARAISWKPSKCKVYIPTTTHSVTDRSQHANLAACPSFPPCDFLAPWLRRWIFVCLQSKWTQCVAYENSREGPGRWGDLFSLVLGWGKSLRPQVVAEKEGKPMSQ